MMPNSPAPARPVRCAIYTRKSTEEGLEKEFNSLDAQREAAEAYIRSQAQEGWVCLPDRYDDGGFTGGTMDRPALQRLLAAITAGKIDAVVTYKVDRLSRSLLDFARMMAVFERQRVSFVSITQQFHTATSMGRLVLNVLLSFAQFEREIISERTRDKIAAARRKGKWAGGMPLLGYDVDPQSTKLLVNRAEARRLRAIFALYLKHQSLLTVVDELARRGWKTKCWTTRKGKIRGGLPFNRSNLYQLLTRVTYLGQVRYKGEVHAGEHAALVDTAVFEQVQALLCRYDRGNACRSGSNALLQGLLRCGSCGRCLVPSHCLRKATTRYRYYRCSGAQQRGARTCPSKPVSAGTIEQLVLDQVRALASDPARLREMIPEPAIDVGETAVAHVSLRRLLDAHWEELAATERAAMLRGLVEQIVYDGVNGKVTIAFHQRGILALITTEDQR
jgi:site-specific DNA recombinase